MPLVSVLIPIHKASDFAVAAIESILANDFEDFELILVLNGPAADFSTHLLYGEFLKDTRVKILRSQESGLVSSLNFGARNAKGTYIARMDFDDISSPWRLRSQVEYLEDNPQVLVLGTQIELMCEHGVSMKRVSKYPQRLRSGKTFKTMKCQIAHPTVLMRKSALFSAGGYRYFFPGSGAEDFDLWNRILRLGEIHNLTNVMLLYRVHGDQISTSQQALQEESTKVAVLLDIFEMNQSRTNLAIPSFVSLSHAKDWLTSKQSLRALPFTGRLRVSWFLSTHEALIAFRFFASLLGIGTRHIDLSSQPISFWRACATMIKNPAAVAALSVQNLLEFVFLITARKKPLCDKCQADPLTSH
jgi:hypothetical protein